MRSDFASASAPASPIRPAAITSPARRARSEPQRRRRVCSIYRPRSPRTRLLAALSAVNLGPIPLLAPRWAFEGYATYVEGRITGSGRPHGTWRPAFLRQWALEGQLPTYDQMSAWGAYAGGEFAYLADGENGLRVVQLTSPETPGNSGFSPRPTPRLIAGFKLPLGAHARAISKGVDRDRAVDESGNQIGVFGRVGARPLNADEQRKMFMHNGVPWTVTDDPNDAVYTRAPSQRPPR